MNINAKSMGEDNSTALPHPKLHGLGTLLEDGPREAPTETDDGESKKGRRKPVPTSVVLAGGFVALVLLFALALSVISALQEVQLDESVPKMEPSAFLSSYAGCLHDVATPTPCGNIVVIDVRSRDAFVAGHIPGAIWASLSDIKSRKPVTQQFTNTDPSTTLVLYCQCPDEHASIQAAIALNAQGLPWERMSALRGGWIWYKQAHETDPQNMPVATGEK